MSAVALDRLTTTTRPARFTKSDIASSAIPDPIYFGRSGTLVVVPQLGTVSRLFAIC